MMKGKYHFILVSSSFRQFFLGLAFILFLIALSIFIVDPDSPGVTLNLGGYSQSEAALFLVIVGTSLIASYYLFRRFLEAKYVRPPDKKGVEDPWTD